MASEFVLSAVLSLRDEFTAKARNVQKSVQSVKDAVEKAAPSINGVSSALGRAGRSAEMTASKAERLKRSLSGVRGNYYATIKGRDELSPLLDKAQTRLNRLRNSKTVVNLKAGLTEKLQGGIGGMASGMMMGAGMQMLGGAGIGFGLYNGIKSAMDFDAAMSGVRAITNAYQEDFEKLRNKALEMGATTKFTATESAQALNYMGMAGWTAEQSVVGLEGVMHLAAASGEDLAMVSDIVTDSMSAFGLEADRAEMFADVLAAAATKSNTNVGKMGYTFKYAAPLAGALGYSIQDVALAVGTMADSGIKGEQAGTSLRSLFTRLAKQPKEAATAMQALGLSMTDANGKMKPLRTMLLDMREKFKGLTEEQQTQYAAMLAGTEGMSGLLAIVNGNEGKFKALADAIDNSSGAAKRMADTRLDNLSGDLTYLSSAWDGFVLKLMNGNATSGLRGFVQEVNSLLNRFSKSVDEHGLGPRSALSLIGDVVVDLKNKFLQLDGVGSILAGGALAGGLYKIYNGVKRIADIAGGGKLSLPGAGNAGASMSSMTVQAGTVVVNGKNITGGVGDMVPGGGAPGAGSGGAAGRAAGAASKWGTFKTLNKIALPLAVAATAYETYNAEPDKRVETVARGAAGIGGAELGAAIGTALAGPVGTVVGGILGSVAGSYVADSAMSGELGRAVEVNGQERIYQEIWEDKNGGIGASAIDEEAELQALEIEKQTAAAWNDLWAGVAESRIADYGVMSAELTAMDDEFANSAQETGNTIIDAFRRSSEDTKSVWSGVAEWFGNIFARISSAVKSIGSPAGVTEVAAPAHATGTMNFGGGLAQINEHGGELVDLPGGSRIYPAQTTERIIQREMQSSQRSAPPVVNISGNSFIVREEADIQKIAYELAQMIGMAEKNYGGA